MLDNNIISKTIQEIKKIKELICVFEAQRYIKYSFKGTAHIPKVKRTDEIKTIFKNFLDEFKIVSEVYFLPNSIVYG